MEGDRGSNRDNREESILEGVKDRRFGGEDRSRKWTAGAEF